MARSMTIIGPLFPLATLYEMCGGLSAEMNTD